AVQVDAAAPGGQGRQHLGQHHKHVAPGGSHASGARGPDGAGGANTAPLWGTIWGAFWAGAPGSVRPRARARSRASVRRRSAAAGSQIWKVRPRPMNTTLS